MTKAMKMKKIVSAACLLMLCSMTMAQTIKVVNKQGQATSYDASKLDSISFQYGTRGFSVHSGDSTDTYTFDKVTNLSVDSRYLFAHPDTVYVGDHTQKFAFQLNTNVEYDATPSNAWLRADGNVTGSDSLRFIATNNPLMTKREGKIIFVNSNDDSMRDTLVVIQAGKTDTHFIDIDWNKATLNSFNETTGQCVITFQGDVPEMGQYDAFLLPTDNSYIIRIVNNATYVDGSKTVTLATREGKMGNLFKNKNFTLCSDPNYSEDPTAAPALARRAGIEDAGTIYYPETIELCADGKPFAVVYDRSKADGSRRAQLSKEFNIFEYSKDNSGEEIGGGLSWESCIFDVGLKGVFQFDFGDIAWEQVRFGDLIDMKAYLEGEFNTELILKYALSAGIEWSAEKVLKEDIFSYRVKFMVGPVPVWINISSDLMAGAEASANGEIIITGGVKASASLKAGMQWSKATGVTPIYEFEKNWELVEPEVKAEAHAEAKAYTWPRIKIGIYDVLCPTIDPKPYIRAYADARAEKIPYFGWDAGLTAGVDLTLGLSLDLFFWEKEIADIEPITLVDVDLVKAPQRIDMMNEASRNLMVGDTCHIIYRVMAKNNLTKSEFPLPGALLHIEKSEDSGGTIDSDQKFNNNPEWCYTNKKGEVVVVYTQNDTIPAKINVTLMTGDEEQDIEVPEWSCAIKDYRLTALDVDETENSIIAGSNGKAEQKYLLEEYTKGDANTNGRWLGMNNVTVNFEVTGGTMEANSAKTKDGGRVTAVFDGGSHYDGKSTLTASAYIAEFDTTLTTSAIKILAFKFEDDELTKCYNLADNTALCYGAFSNGDILDVTWVTKVFNGYMNWVDIGINIGKDYNEVIAYTNTESGQGAGYYNGEPHECDYVQTVNWKYTYTHKDVICGYNAQNNLPMDFVGRHTNATSAVQEERYGTVENTATTHYTYYGTNDQGERVVIGTDTKNSSYGPNNIGPGQWWNAARENTAGVALFEEDGNIVYLYYIIDEAENYRLYVKGVFDKASNTVYE
jgi:hypothetical protein